MNAGDTAWVLISAALVLFMSIGLAFFYGGLEPRRNVLDMLMLNFVTIAIVSVTWAMLGFTLAFGPDAGHGLVGNLHFAGLANMNGIWPGTHVPKFAFMAYQMMFAVITPALITGAVAGRLKLEAWIAFCLVWSLLVYPLTAHWLFDPSGWLYRMGARDFAGGAVVHASAGAAALVFVLVVGPRSKRAAAHYKPHSVPMVLLGAGILWFGWFGFNAGSALSAGELAASSFTNTQLAAAGGCLAWLVMERWRSGRVTIVGAATGAVVGLATVTPASGFVGPMPALLIGVLSGLVCYAATRVLSRRHWFDDSFGVVGIHGVGGIAGMLLLGVFAEHSVNAAGLTSTNGAAITGLAFGDPVILLHQLIAVAAVVAFSMLVTYVVAKAVQRTLGLHVPVEQEDSAVGLDAAFDEFAYEPANEERPSGAAHAAVT